MFGGDINLLSRRKSNSSLNSMPPSPLVRPKETIRRNSASPSVPSNKSTGRGSMEGFDRMRFLRSQPMEKEKSPLSRKTRHKRSSSSPSILSPPLAPTNVSSSMSLSSGHQSSSMASLASMVLESEVEPLDLLHSDNPRSSVDETLPSRSTYASTLFFRSGSVSNTPMATPPASPALHASTTRSAVNPSPSTTPPSSPSPSFMATWGRLPSIPRPSPMMPFRAAKKVVDSVVGTGLLPSKEQLGAIPVAGRILTHPVMDSTLTYIASKANMGGKDGTPIAPEDLHYRKLNKRLVDHSMTLSMLAMEKEDESKTMVDEAADDAFELYLAAIGTLVHALPFETCDPLRREALESQLRSLLHENQPDTDDEEETPKQRRRRRRQRHRVHHDNASILINQHSTSSKEEGPTFSETIISTAVESAIKLKQSPIPDVVRTCFRASKLLLEKVEERFNLQERAWQISKSSIEKVLELDEQYSIHEAISETFFAAITGIVKAGIAYKETPSYAAVKALEHSHQAQIEGPLMITDSDRSQQAIRAIMPPRRYSIIEEVDEESSSPIQSPIFEYEEETEGSSSCFSTSEDEDGDDRTIRRKSQYAGPDSKIGIMRALQGAASAFITTVASN
ncbi:hypothetical protein BGZ76_003329 [Entomortierella beljakovae]|nr:hypothetical protein BGZ76_003329 [Entomortierella beljakovae]